MNAKSVFMSTLGILIGTSFCAESGMCSESGTYSKSELKPSTKKKEQAQERLQGAEKERFVAVEARIRELRKNEKKIRGNGVRVRKFSPEEKESLEKIGNELYRLRIERDALMKGTWEEFKTAQENLKTGNPEWASSDLVDSDFVGSDVDVPSPKRTSSEAQLLNYLADLQTTVKEQEKTLQEFSEKLTSTNARLDAFGSQNNLAVQENTEQKKEIEALENENAERKQEGAVIKQQISALEQQINAMKQLLEALNQRIWETNRMGSQGGSADMMQMMMMMMMMR